MNFNFNPEHTFFTSDTHFNHANIIKFCYRPFKDVEHMNEAMIANWNRVVRADDTVFHLGDFCLGGAAEWTKVLDRLNGKIYLILGNHDLKNLRQGFIGRFEHVAMQMHITIGKQRIYLCHYPFLCFEGGYREVWQLFGHVHTRKNNTGLDAERLKYLYPTQYDVGVDNNNYTPVSFEQVNQIIKKQLDKRQTMKTIKLPHIEAIAQQWKDNPIVERLEDSPIPGITQIEHIKELQEILVQTCLDFINKHGLTDIYSVSFNADELAYSAQHRKWQPATDSYIKVEGIRFQNHRRKNGEIFQMPCTYVIGEYM